MASWWLRRQSPCRARTEFSSITEWSAMASASRWCFRITRRQQQFTWACRSYRGQWPKSRVWPVSKKKPRRHHQRSAHCGKAWRRVPCPFWRALGLSTGNSTLRLAPAASTQALRFQRFCRRWSRRTALVTLPACGSCTPGFSRSLCSSSSRV